LGSEVGEEGSSQSHKLCGGQDTLQVNAMLLDEASLVKSAQVAARIVERD